MHPKQSSHTTNRPAYPEYSDEFGEDPARFLCSSMDPRPRIRGIRDRSLLDAYLDVELEHERRKEVIGAINARIMDLEDGVGAAGQAGAVAATDGGEER